MWFGIDWSFFEPRSLPLNPVFEVPIEINQTTPRRKINKEVEQMWMWRRNWRRAGRGGKEGDRLDCEIILLLYQHNKCHSLRRKRSINFPAHGEPPQLKFSTTPARCRWRCINFPTPYARKLIQCSSLGARKGVRKTSSTAGSTQTTVKVCAINLTILSIACC